MTAAPNSNAALDLSTEEVELDQDGRVNEDISCRRCGYNLRGLLLNGRCPECATPVGRSIQGDLLQFSDPRWVGQLASGMNWLLVSIVIGVVAPCLVSIVANTIILPQPVLAIFMTGLSQPVSAILMIGLGVIPLVGYWKVTTPDPAEPEEPGMNARKLTRFTQVAGFCLWPLKDFSRLAGLHFIMITLNFVGPVIGIVGFFAVFRYARRLAIRIPDNTLARHCRIVMWGLVTMTAIEVVILATTVMKTPMPIAMQPVFPLQPIAVAVISVTVGSLVFGIWSIVFVVKFRRALHRAAQYTTATWAVGRQNQDLISASES